MLEGRREKVGRVKEGRTILITAQNQKAVNCAQIYCSNLGALGSVNVNKKAKYREPLV
jgi:hypothetical protein